MPCRKTLIVGLSTLALFSSWAFWIGGEDAPTGLEPYTTSVQQVIDLVHAGKTEEAFTTLDSLYSAVVTLRADLRGLRFAGTAQTLFDPSLLPAGTYRVHLITGGVATVEIVDMDGQPLEFLFLLSSGYASTLYTSTGQRILVHVSLCTEPYTILFEKL
jgi:hypothetical protein